MNNRIREISNYISNLSNSDFVMAMFYREIREFEGKIDSDLIDNYIETAYEWYLNEYDENHVIYGLALFNLFDDYLNGDLDFDIRDYEKGMEHGLSYHYFG